MNNMKLGTNIFISVMLVTLIAGYDIAHPKELPQTTPVEAKEVEVVEVTYDTPKEYIIYKFGDYADKAFLLLQGRGAGSCAENRNLDQGAVNRNWVKGQPGVYWSTDYGIFQINDKFHPVKGLRLDTDWKANIDYAYRAFVKSGYSFNLWTCGKIYGI
jgi:hypothetical protein